MFAEEFDDRGCVRLPVLGEAFKIGEDGGDSCFDEESDGVFEIFVEVGVEDSLIHEVKARADVEENPAKIVKLQRREDIGSAFDGVFDLLAVVADCLLAAGFDLADDGEAVTGGRLREDGAVASLFEFEVALFGDRHCGGKFPGVVCHVVLLEVCETCGGKPRVCTVEASEGKVGGILSVFTWMAAGGERA